MKMAYPNTANMYMKDIT